MSVREVVVTGLGAIGPWGLGRTALAEALAVGRPLAVEVDRSSGFHAGPGSRHAALVPDLELARLIPAAQARRLARPSRWALAAARLALEDAGLATLDGRRAAVVLATAFGSVLFTERLVRQILEEGPESAQPFYFSECVANASAAQIALALGARGANVTITQRESGPLLALARGVAEVREGRADCALVGAADEMTPLLHALLDRYRATAREEDGLPEAARPFDARRNGILAGEGAAVLVIEPEESARRRGAPVLARVAATVSAFDASATASDWGVGGAQLASALSRGLGRAGRSTRSIDRIVSGASGSARADRLEARILREAFPESTRPPVLAPKAVVGEFGAGHLAASILAVAGASFGPPASFQAGDDDLGVAPHDGTPLPPPSSVLASSLASGGAAAWALLERA